MALFNTRSSKREADNATARNVPIDSVQTLRTRARQRLIGSVVLVALGIIVFTLLFDSQPRPIPVNTTIVIPDKDKPEAVVTAPASIPVAPVASVAPVPEPAATAVAVAVAAPSVASPIVVAPSTSSPAAASTAVQTSASLDLKEEIVTAKTNKKPDAPSPVASVVGERFIVQFGAYAENDKAREARLKVEGTGLKTYVHVAETPQGRRIRLRVGPFATKAEAEKAAEKIKTLNLPTAILTL